MNYCQKASDSQFRLLLNVSRQVAASSDKAFRVQGFAGNCYEAGSTPSCRIFAFIPSGLRPLDMP